MKSKLKRAGIALITGVASAIGFPAVAADAGAPQVEVSVAQPGPR